ncbi:Aste57867_18064 [Aphanomyces stellatus]|uniref:Aste57867_18064 protein n=1 Tax=Aphanomyces stellatus TaxID=120398 RepID=A0A485L944_9STRA|nr:hypothetical protein As57867_018002 [Aphanomyces stellatus]VFT94803.1 Aste57867_18064 [Aphanomyces stellatus]
MAPRSTKSRKLKPTLTADYLGKWFRVLSNISAGLLIVGTGVLVCLLLYQGMFSSSLVYNVDPSSYMPFFRACRLTAVTGFHSCDALEVNVTGAAAWTSIGHQLAADLDLTASSAPLFVTTCVAGGGRDDGFAALALIVADAAFPVCNPVGPQPILSHSMVETVTTLAFPQGAFLLTTFADNRPLNVTHLAQTSGPSASVTTSVVKTIVAVDGTRTATKWDQVNYATSLNSLNRLFLMRVMQSPIFMDISTIASDVPGYNIGHSTRWIVSFAWHKRHAVDNYILLFLFQILISCVSLCLLANDGVITLEGLSGLVKNKPVLTYDILASLERRKVLLVALICTFFFSPLYADAIRYTYDINGHHYWSISLLMVAVMMALSWMALLTCLQYLPVPVTSWRHKPLCYNAPVLVYCSIVFFVVVEAAQNRGPSEAVAFWTHATPTLHLNIAGTLWPSGGFDLDGTTPVIYLLMSDLIVSVVGAWLVSIVAHKLFFGNVILDTSWTSHNDFTNQVAPPQYVTSLDLDKKNTITIGNKLYCKPSTIVLLGYCTVRAKTKYSIPVDGHGGTNHNASSRESSLNEPASKSDAHPSSSKGVSHHGSHVGAMLTSGDPGANSKALNQPSRAAQYYVVSIYSLVPALESWLRRSYPPQVFGVINSNKFQVCKSNTKLEQNTTYVYSRGDCCG